MAVYYDKEEKYLDGDSVKESRGRPKDGTLKQAIEKIAI